MERDVRDGLSWNGIVRKNWDDPAQCVDLGHNDSKTGQNTATADGACD